MRITFSLVVGWLFLTIILCSAARMALEPLYTALSSVQTTTRYSIVGTR